MPDWYPPSPPIPYDPPEPPFIREQQTAGHLHVDQPAGEYDPPPPPQFRDDQADDEGDNDEG